MDKKNLEHKTEEKDSRLVEIAKGFSGSMKALFGSNTNYGIYHRNGWAFLALAYTTNYYNIHPIVSVPIFAVAGYNFIQAYRHRNELFK